MIFKNILAIVNDLNVYDLILFSIGLSILIGVALYFITSDLVTISVSFIAGLLIILYGLFVKYPN